MPDLPPDVRVIETPRCVRYRLPRRELGPWHYAGVIPMLFGIFFAMVPAGMLLDTWRDLLGGNGGGSLIFPLFSLLILLLFLLVAAMPVALGLFIFAGRSEIQLSDTQLKNIERAGPIRWSWSRTWEQIQRLQIGAPPTHRLQRPSDGTIPLTAFPGLPSDLSCLTALPHAGSKPLLLAPAYPRATLLALAHDIAERRNQRHGVRLFDDNKHDLEVVTSPTVSLEDAPAVEPTPAPLPDQPADSAASLEYNAAGLTLTIPPAGLWRGSKGLFLFGLAWCGFMAVFTPMWFIADAHRAVPLPLIAFLLAFWGIGIAMLVAAVNMGRRHAIVDVVGPTLLVTRQSLFGTKQQEWTRDEIADIRVGPSGVEVNNRPLMNLQIRLKDGKKIGLFTERHDDELHWIAALLRQALAAQGGEVSSSKFRVSS